MPLKKTAATRRAVEMEIELPGTPEQIWQAMATGPGNAAWFVPTIIEEKVGGRLEFQLGGGATSHGVVTVWQPPHRFGYEELGWSGEAPPLATEIVIEAASGGTCRVRMVHSLFTDRDDWDKEMESFETGWPAFFAILRLYLRHFAGEPAASSRPMGGFGGDPAAAWAELTRRLGLDGARPGERRDTAVDGAPQLAGTVEEEYRIGDHQALMLRLDTPAPGIALMGAFSYAGKSHIALSLYFYGRESAAVEARESPRWHAWMAEQFPFT
ncbi:hypothetical protein RHODGE_RHODGE_02771 [Rhodoplanes serenus]|uniref:Activator of Hsp90 ATPase homologue 1/2-like C-terminal domain-containing protein n=1 Tax=Rhodoplanes serenus TaxID=200615 RepID=A0A447CWH6_9BRAD|nr:SRPBCC domain-containing protein [Rhodoplanes serenus]MBI5111013.1 SRPBCC domain-containing protein [Rhodovulum sp.]VCU09600.1 hypothetical protein RHODGE_RHODGE_02771 [Rhodoplanes serenus]